jgi:hypothetical protein
LIERDGAKRWQVGLLLLHPPLSAAYLLALRAGWLAPSFFPPLFAAAAPLASAVLGTVRLARGGERGRAILLLATALFEVVWAVVVLAIVGFAIAWRMG